MPHARWSRPKSGDSSLRQKTSSDGTKLPLVEAPSLNHYIWYKLQIAQPRHIRFPFPLYARKEGWLIMRARTLIDESRTARLYDESSHRP
jgi:hypothetical protein